MLNIANRTLFTHDNLEVMRGINSASIDLIYLDPPFNSKKNYAAPIGSEAAGAAFKDTWSLDDIKKDWAEELETEDKAIWAAIISAGYIGGESMQAYLIYISIRLREMKRLLKVTGSIYLHCDPTASHYLKMVMDSIFGKQNFRAEINWKRHNAHNDKLYGTIHDTIFYYAYCDKKIPAEVRIPLSPCRLKNFRYSDERGPYSVGDLTGPGRSTSQSGAPWRGFNPTALGRTWSVPLTGRYAEYIENNFIPNYRSIKNIHDRLDILAKNGFITWTQNKTPQLKRYLMPEAGSPPQSLWTDIMGMNANEKTGYPTQKPLALLERIIKASSNPGDMVLDPFCGCATTCIAAEKLGRQWIGIDIEEKARELVIERLEREVDNWSLLNGGGRRPDITHHKLPPRRTDPDIPIRRSNIKQILYNRQEGRCAAPCEDGETTGRALPIDVFEIDHIKPRSKGGEANLQLLCPTCNRKKGNRTMTHLI